jgi:hypothetical protein
MATDRPIRYQKVSLTIPLATNVISAVNVTTDKLYQRVTGIYATCSDATGMNNSTFDKFDIDNQEIYPTGFEAKLISTGQEVPPNDKFDHDINERANQSAVAITYRDGGAGTAYPYTVNFYLRLENPNEERAMMKNRFFRAIVEQFKSWAKKVKE